MKVIGRFLQWSRLLMLGVVNVLVDLVNLRGELVTRKRLDIVPDDVFKESVVNNILFKQVDESAWGSNDDVALCILSRG